MRVLTVYDSLFGNTEKIAFTINQKISSHHESYVIKADRIREEDTKNIDLVIIGSPTHGGRFTEPIKKFIGLLSANKTSTLRAITFDTSFPTKNMGFFINHIVPIFGNAAPKLSKKLQKNGIPVIGSKIFYVLDKEGPLREGEIEKAEQWIEDMLNKIKSF